MEEVEIVEAARDFRLFVPRAGSQDKRSDFSLYGKYKFLGETKLVARRLARLGLNRFIVSSQKRDLFLGEAGSASGITWQKIA
jgi:hypothetical protein